MNEEIKPLEPVTGSWDVGIVWKEGTTIEEKDEAQDFIKGISDEANGKDTYVPECIVGISLRKI